MYSSSVEPRWAPKVHYGNLSLGFVRSIRIDVAKRLIPQLAKPFAVNLLRHSRAPICVPRITREVARIFRFFPASCKTDARRTQHQPQPSPEQQRSAAQRSDAKAWSPALCCQLRLDPVLTRVCRFWTGGWNEPGMITNSRERPRPARTAPSGRVQPRPAPSPRVHPRTPPSPWCRDIVSLYNQKK